MPRHVWPTKLKSRGYNQFEYISNKQWDLSSNRLLTKKSPGLDKFIPEFQTEPQNRKGRNTTRLDPQSHKASIILISTTKKQICRPTSFFFLNIDTKSPANWIEVHTSWPCWFHYRMMQGWFNICKLINDIQNRLKDINHIVQPTQSVEKRNLISSASLVVKFPRKLRIEGTHLDIIKAVCTKPIASIILNSKNLKHLLWSQE